jgi:hypothetical protein
MGPNRSQNPNNSVPDPFMMLQLSQSQRQLSRTVLPVAAERRAASRISVTIKLFLSADSPEG